MAKRKKRICFLCGKIGADSKDHVPPKGLLPPATEERQRITVPAHRKCNSDGSEDEEYVRDLLIPAAVQQGLPETDEVYKKVWRSWSASGWNRYQEFVKDARPVELRTKSGLYVGRAIGITYDRERVLRVGRKIARGIIFHDSQAVMKDDEIGIASLTVAEAMKEREDNAQEPYWIGLNHPACKHTMFGEAVALRRFYRGRSLRDRIAVETHIAIILWDTYMAASTVIPFDRIVNKNFEFCIDAGGGKWTTNLG